MSSQPRLHLLFRRDEIEATVKRLAAEISGDYYGKYPLLIGVLKGSFMISRWKWSLYDYPAMVGAGRVRGKLRWCRVFALRLRAGMYW